MAHLLFYEKPGCINNTRQKQLLRSAGHLVECRDLLEQKWDSTQLLKFFGSLPVSMWFNSSAPAIRDGDIDPSSLDENEALELMIKDPILIRRPLMKCGDDYRVGFEISEVDAWIGLASENDNEDLESCPQKNGHDCS